VIRDLQYYEQRVNDRFGTSSAPPVDAAMLPEAGRRHPLKWRRLPRDGVEIFSDHSRAARAAVAATVDDQSVYLPVHPLEEDRWPHELLIDSGTISISASYRTVFFEPEPGGMLAGVAGPDEALMIKLHLEVPLPGIAGDRRLNRARVEKCVTLGDALQKALSRDPLADRLVIVPEFLGVATEGPGVLYRALPSKGILPLFSLTSMDPERGESLLSSWLRDRYGDDTARGARELGDQLARPLVRSLFAGFRAGFSLEMHAQNTLIAPGANDLIDVVYFRDLEGVVFSNAYRARNGLGLLFPDIAHDELKSESGSMTRWFNRNLDHDLGRVFRAALVDLERSGLFGRAEQRAAIHSIRRVVRQTVAEAGLEKLFRAGRWLPVSRSPYGNGLSKGHYYRTVFR
jgi:hypothetical protein